jgi:hypothetical protein
MESGLQVCVLQRFSFELTIIAVWDRVRPMQQLIKFTSGTFQMMANSWAGQTVGENLSSIYMLVLRHVCTYRTHFYLPVASDQVVDYINHDLGHHPHLASGRHST